MACRDEELTDALVAFGLITGELSDAFVERITFEVATRGHLKCRVCSDTMRQHVIRALHQAAPLDHKFAEYGN